MTTVHDGQLGFGLSAACTAAGVAYRHLDYWSRLGLVVPSLRSNANPRRRLYSVRDIVLLAVVRRLLDGGARVGSLWPVVSTLRTLPDLSAAIIVSDGNMVHLYQTADESADRLRPGEAVLTVHVRDAVAAVNDVLASGLPAEPAHRPGPRAVE